MEGLEHLQNALQAHYPHGKRKQDADDADDEPALPPKKSQSSYDDRPVAQFIGQPNGPDQAHTITFLTKADLETFLSDTTTQHHGLLQKFVLPQVLAGAAALISASVS
eukprot:gene5021-5133_t